MVLSVDHSWSIRLICSALLCFLIGCASDDPPIVQATPDPSIQGVIAWGEVRGERVSQIQGAIESGALQMLPNLQWLVGRSERIDVALDLQVFSARTNDVSSTQEQRNCRRWSEPDRDAKGTLQKLISRQCIDWQVQQLPCLTRTYEADAQIRARLQHSQRIIASDRKIVQASERRCGSERPITAQLQAQAETQLAQWVIRIIRDPLAQWSSARIVSTPAVTSQAAVTSVTNPGTSVIPSNPAPTQSQALKVRPHALIIGNANYPGSARLANPINDALGMERKLTELGFSVTRILDGDRETLIRGLSQFQKTAADSQVTLLYYSGHGMQIDGVNYLVPVNIDLRQGASLKLQGIAIDTLIESYVPGTTKLIFLDACRDNPAVSSGFRGFGRGLAPIQAPTGTLIAYATRDGGVAEDGAGKHSPYTQALLDVIDQPEDISLLLRRVRDKVMKETAGRQQPWEYGSLSGGELVLSRLK
jgi:Caspase domain